MYCRKRDGWGRNPPLGGAVAQYTLTHTQACPTGKHSTAHFFIVTYFPRTLQSRCWSNVEGTPRNMNSYPICIPMKLPVITSQNLSKVLSVRGLRLPTFSCFCLAASPHLELIKIPTAGMENYIFVWLIRGWEDYRVDFNTKRGSLKQLSKERVGDMFRQRYIGLNLYWIRFKGYTHRCECLTDVYWVCIDRLLSWVSCDSATLQLSAWVFLKKPLQKCERGFWKNIIPSM